MCGIAGVISKNINDKLIVEDIISFQFNRGPDFNKIENSKINEYHLCLGHNRLSINDLSEASNQPLWDVDKNYCILFNGEIYNYVEIRSELIRLGKKFKTTGDTEVLLIALITWGINAIDKIDGMFSFCFVSYQESKVIFARDRFNKKPFYYSTTNNRFIFASTPTIIAKAIKASPNFNYVQKGLKYWLYEDGSSITQYQDIFALEGGNVLCLDLKNSIITPELKSYYNLYDKISVHLSEGVSYNYNEQKDRIHSLLEDSIRIRLRSDVPVAISLSGGLDSSTIASIAKRLNNDIEGIHFGSPSQKQSEGPLVKILSDYLGLKVNYIWPDTSEIIQAFEKSFEAQDSPILGTSYIAEFLVYKYAHELGVKVMLGGQGGDEIFMGYRKYQYYKFLDDLKNKRIVQSSHQALMLLRIFKSELFQIGAYLNSMKRYSKKQGLESVVDLSNFIENSTSDIGQNMNLWERQVFDVIKYSVPVQVKSEDRNSMYNSVETRAPFLDYRLVEEGIKLPVNYKLKDGYGKWIIRDIMKNKIPDEIRLSRFKRGYDVSQDWIGMGIGKYLRNRLSDNSNNVHKFMGKGLTIDMFTDDYFRNKRTAFQEATTLIWLGERF